MASPAATEFADALERMLLAAIMMSRGMPGAPEAMDEAKKDLAESLDGAAQ